MTDVRVTTPASSEFVHVLRTVAAGLAARAGFSVDEIEDLRLAVDEAAARLLAERPGSRTLLLEADVAGGSLELLVACDADQAPWPPPGLDATLTWQVLPALVDRAEPLTTAHGPGFRLTKRAAGMT